MKQIGFIGLGIMGRPMAANLVRANLPVVVWNRTAEKMNALCEMGATAAGSVAELAEQCDYIITMLPDSPQVKSVVVDGGLLEHARPSTLLIDMSSIAPEASREIGGLLKQRGIRMLDAPVSGGEPKAVDGTLAIMVGGEECDFREAGFLFDILGSSARYIGPLGSGNVCKLTNQIIVAANLAALSEGFLLAETNGIDPALIYEAIHGGLAGSAVMEAKTRMMADRRYEPGFKIDLHIKDLNNAMASAQAGNLSLPVAQMVRDIMLHLREQGRGDLDHSAVYQYYLDKGNCHG